jgi:hypothetical protein
MLPCLVNDIELVSNKSMEGRVNMKKSNIHKIIVYALLLSASCLSAETSQAQNVIMKDLTQYCSFNEFYAKLMPFFRKERIWREPRQYLAPVLDSAIT